MASTNTFYTPEQVAKVAVALASEDSYLGALVSRNFEDDLLGGGGRGKAVNLRVPSAMIARSRDIDATDAIVMDALVEKTVSVSLGAHIYDAIPLTEGDINLKLEDFSKQVLAPQVGAVVDYVEEEVAKALRAVTLDTSVRWDVANPVKTFTEIRKILRKRGVSPEGLNVVVGTDVYAALLDANAITDASQSGSTAALREGNVGKLRGFTVAESTRIADDEIVAFHRDAFTLAVRAPKVAEGVAFGKTINSGGYSLRYLREYDVTTTVNRSMVSTFAGVAKMPLYRVDRNYTTNTAQVVEVPEGATFRMSTGDAEPVA